ncbi:ABC transporter ATP-binding protein [Halococcus hamelinensis]|uniref:ABC transporter n=1 Tax=Halococcus hamelinensis 100A6 TaxID=1132509 RepID=M0M2K6_9EURY|nr:ABC transporter ATP-binding protein [Halococcus hamelinensis]EMA39623.1 ABC transporter [Halococcus hamelinensis 100A6]
MAALRTEGLTKYYGETRGIEDLSFSVREGEVFGFLGPNGAGKTTTIRTLLGFQSPTGGSATVLGRDVTDEAAMIDAKRHLGYVPAEMGFDERVTGERFLRYQASLKGDQRSEELLKLFDPPMERTIGEYSTGNERKLALVLAFMHDPDLVIMDEPTSGLDPLMQERFYEFVRDEQARGVTFFFSSHVLSEVQKICDRVGIIRNGTLVELETVETLLDRGGKHVSARVSESVDPAAFVLDGAHDVEVISDRTPTHTSADGGRTGAADVEDDVRPGSSSGRTGTTVRFTYTGDYNVLLDHLGRYDVLDLDIGDAPLEDVFMRFYGETEPSSGGEERA